MHPVEKVAAPRAILDEFTARAHWMVWCNLATLDRRGRPRLHVVHPIWDGEMAWIGSLPSTPKIRDIERDPHVSLAYIADIAKPVYADCIATWVDDLAGRARIWERFRTTPAPLGYDPAPVFGSHDQPDSGLIQLAPYRAEVTNWPHGSRIWRRADG